jgi:Zn-dependent peptidase ImmA (M78 family)
LFGASSFSKEHGSFIFVNCNEVIPEERQIFSLIHELGHLIFHRNEYQDPKYCPFYEKTRGNIKEKVADTFSGYFLLPRHMLKKYVDDRHGKINTTEMKNHFKVSIQALYMALKKYGMISEERYKSSV